jgi:hypothetical protein
VVVRAIREIVDARTTAAEAVRDTPNKGSLPPRHVLCVSARTATDETVWMMLGQLVDQANLRLESVGSSFLASEADAATAPELLTLLSIPPGGLVQTRYLCRRLRAKFPSTPILVIRPSQVSRAESTEKLMKEGATKVCFTLREAQAAAEGYLIRGDQD